MDRDLRLLRLRYTDESRPLTAHQMQFNLPGGFVLVAINGDTLVSAELQELILAQPLTYGYEFEKLKRGDEREIVAALVEGGAEPALLPPVEQPTEEQTVEVALPATLASSAAPAVPDTQEDPPAGGKKNKEG